MQHPMKVPNGAKISSFSLRIPDTEIEAWVETFFKLLEDKKLVSAAKLLKAYDDRDRG